VAVLERSSNALELLGRGNSASSMGSFGSKASSAELTNVFGSEGDKQAVGCFLNTYSPKTNVILVTVEYVDLLHPETGTL
jgi:hypothetical protein